MPDSFSATQRAMEEAVNTIRTSFAPLHLVPVALIKAEQEQRSLIADTARCIEQRRSGEAQR